MTFKHGFLGLVAAFLVTVGCEPGGAPEGTSGETEGPVEGHGGRLVIVGGALRDWNTPVYQAVLEGRQGEGPLCVLPTASGVPESSMEGSVAVFDSIGGPGTALGIFLTVDNAQMANDEGMAAQIRDCSGFFFTGGVQSRVVEVLRPGGATTLVHDALWDRYRAGAVVSGSSAGAAIMTDPMIAGGGSEEALQHGLSSGDEGQGVLLEPGIGFLDRGIVDQHFLARGRWGRLLVTVLNSQGDGLGFGIDENTALVVDGDSAWVAGESGVIFLDGRHATREDGGQGGYGVRLFLMGVGDLVDLRTGEVTPEPSKEPLPGPGAHFQIADADLFSSWTLLQVLAELGESQDLRITLSQGDHLVELRKEPDFYALSWDDVGIQGTRKGLSLGPFVLSVWGE